MDAPTYRECEFRLDEMVLRGKRWGTPGGRPALALHGWIDNCASFDLLAPLLPELDLVCLDLAGHGRSDYRTRNGGYSVWQDVGEVFAVADALSWDRFALIGHSRGAWLAAMAAGTFPQRITHLAGIEGFFPPLDTAAEAPARLAKTIQALRQQLSRPRRYYPSYEYAVIGRMKGIVRLARENAEAMARWGVEQSPEGYSWRYDTRVLPGPELRLTREQVAAFVQNITARTRVYIASEGMLAGNQMLRAWLDEYSRVEKLFLTGDHHLHMQSGSAAVAADLRQFLSV